MAESIIALACTDATSAPGPDEVGNVLTFPKPRRRARRQARAASSCQVLAFTGHKRFVYDRDEVLLKHRDRMMQMALDLYTDIATGKYTGVMILATTDHWEGHGDMPTDGAGIFLEDPIFAAQGAQLLLASWGDAMQEETAHV